MTGAQIIRQTLDVENACPSAECLLEEFMLIGRDLLKRFHHQDYRMLERLVCDPADAVVIAAGNLLDVNGELQRAEIRRFLETGEQHLSRVRDSELHGKWRSFVSVRLKRTVVEMREDDNPWARKIRWSVEKVVCKEASVQRIADSRTVLYYRAIDGDPDLDATRMGTDEILAELLSYPSRANSIRTLVMTVFDIMQTRDCSCRALSMAELTHIIVNYYGTFLSIEGDGVCEEEKYFLDDLDLASINSTVNFLKDGRLAHYLAHGIYSVGEGHAIAAMVRSYLIDLRFGRKQTLREYIQMVFPDNDARVMDALENKRISNLLVLVSGRYLSALASRS